MAFPLAMILPSVLFLLVLCFLLFAPHARQMDERANAATDPLDIPSCEDHWGTVKFVAPLF